MPTVLPEEISIKYNQVKQSDMGILNLQINLSLEVPEQRNIQLILLFHINIPT